MGAGAESRQTAALDSVEVLSATGHVKEEAFGVASPTPAWCWWDHDPTSGPLFQATNDDGFGNADCQEVWSVHCDGERFVLGYAKGVFSVTHPEPGLIIP